MGRDPSARPVSVSAVVVSIHAPAWGATGVLGVGELPGRVSIHAPAWGATSTASRGPPRRCFNSRARVGRDPDAGRLYEEYLAFQFTRPRGARRGAVRTGERGRGFNSRARVGRDAAAAEAAGVSERFQFTRPRGARLVQVLDSSSKNFGFNSRARVGRDTPAGRCRTRTPCFNSRARVGRDSGKNRC